MKDNVEFQGQKMSSLLQFRGETKRGYVGLEMYLTTKTYPYPRLPTCPVDREVDTKVPCTICTEVHTQLYRVWRKPAGMFGCWVVFRYNGKEHVPDLSCPFNVEKIPRGAIKLSPEENSKAWHKS